MREGAGRLATRPFCILERFGSVAVRNSPGVPWASRASARRGTTPARNDLDFLAAWNRTEAHAERVVVEGP